MRGIYIDENGESHYYDFMEMIGGDYYQYSKENDYHPLNKDLMIFLKSYGKDQGWYNTTTSAFATIKSGEFLEASAWLASCYSTVSSFEPEIEDAPIDTPNETPDDTGDDGIMGAVIVMAIAAMGVTMVVTKKKVFK